VLSAQRQTELNRALSTLGTSREKIIEEVDREAKEAARKYVDEHISFNGNSLTVDKQCRTAFEANHQRLEASGPSPSPPPGLGHLQVNTKLLQEFVNFLGKEAVEEPMKDLAERLATALGMAAVVGSRAVTVFVYVLESTEANPEEIEAIKEIHRAEEAERAAAHAVSRSAGSGSGGRSRPGGPEPSYGHGPLQIEVPSGPSGGAAPSGPSSGVHWETLKAGDPSAGPGANPSGVTLPNKD
jgi:hypothetical protein